MTGEIGRRRFLQATAALAALGAMPRLVRRAVAADGSVFSLGVASGDPSSRSVILWTRLAPDPLNGGGLDTPEVPVDWEIFADEGLTDLVQQGRASASAESAH